MRPGELITSDRGARARTADDLSHAWRVLGQVMDPEVPAVSVVDLGIVRGLDWQAGHLHVVAPPPTPAAPFRQIRPTTIHTRRPRPSDGGGHRQRPALSGELTMAHEPTLQSFIGGR